jgi:hypothetical protein
VQRKRLILLGSILVCLIGFVAIGVTAQDQRPRPTGKTAPAAKAKPAPKAAAGGKTKGAKAKSGVLQEGVTLGTGAHFGNITVFPILSSVQRDVGEFVTLEQALKEGKAVVRELEDGADVTSSSSKTERARTSWCSQAR